MTRERLHDISFNRKPDLKMLDGWGRVKPMPVADAKQPPSSSRTVYEAVADEINDRGAETRPGWLRAAASAPRCAEEEEDEAATERRLDEAHAAAASEMRGAGAAQSGEDGRSDAEQEAARVQWLQYYLKAGEWEKAEELVVSAGEREDLEFLREKQTRQG